MTLFGTQKVLSYRQQPSQNPLNKKIPRLRSVVSVTPFLVNVPSLYPQAGDNSGI